MQIRLTDTDLRRISAVQGFFRNIEPVAVDLGNSEVVRIALRELVVKLGLDDDTPPGNIGKTLTAGLSEAARAPAKQLSEALHEALTAPGRQLAGITREWPKVPIGGMTLRNG